MRITYVSATNARTRTVARTHHRGHGTSSITPRTSVTMAPKTKAKNCQLSGPRVTVSRAFVSASISASPFMRSLQQRRHRHAEGLGEALKNYDAGILLRPGLEI